MQAIIARINNIVSLPYGITVDSINFLECIHSANPTDQTTTDQHIKNVGIFMNMNNRMSD